jgi:autonomous glycyl radical cofactor GrcA
METGQIISPAGLWTASGRSPRVGRLRDQYFSFYDREFTNEVRSYTTGTPWDVVYAIWNWTSVPEMAMFLQGACSYLRVGGTCIQLNVIDANTLREAQKHPDEYRDLLVPVTGYSAYFVESGREIHDEIIADDSHQLGWQWA